MKTGLCCLIVPPPVSPFPLHLSPAAFAPCPCGCICCLNRCEEWASQQSISEPLLFYPTAAGSCATSPGWHPHTCALTAGCVEMPPALTGTWAARGEGQGEGTSAVKSWWIHLCLEWGHTPCFVDRANPAMASYSWSRSKLTWGADFRMPQASALAGSGLSTGPLEVSPQFCRHCLWEALNNPSSSERAAVPPCSCWPCLTCFVCWDQRIHRFSHAHHETRSGKKVYREKTPTYFYFWKVTFALITIMQIFTY